MNVTPVPLYIGILSVVVLFIVCYFLGATVRLFYLYFKGLLAFKPATTKRKRKKSPPKPIKSIEIDPEEIDRIYVKKSD